MPLCPACKVDGPPGRYCASCGAIREDASCVHCGGPLPAGTRFCPACGNPVATAPGLRPLPAAPPGSRLPWIIGGLSLAALLVIVAIQRVSTGVTQPNPVAAAPAAPLTTGRAPDISQMSPRERAARLFDRIMRLDEEGKRDSVALFASMAIPTFQSLQPLDAHLRYDLGRIAAAAGDLALAQAQADTILQARPQHLLGLALAAQVAERRGDLASARRLRARLIAAEAAERAEGLEEYQLHEADIRAAVAAGGGSR